MPIHFTQFNQGGNILPGDIIVGLRNGQNTQFNASSIPEEGWTILTIGQPLAMDAGYIMENIVPQNYSLPVNATFGSVIQIMSNTNAGFTITQNAGQYIQAGNTPTTVGVAGSLTSNSIGDGLTLVCIQANTVFEVLGAPEGNWIRI